MERFDQYFRPKKNTIHARAVFGQRLQKPGESVESFIRNLYVLAPDCDFGDNKNEFIRDRIVAGIRDKDVSKQLQMKSDLTLDVAIEMARQAETIQYQMSEQTQAQAVDELRGKKKNFTRNKDTPQKQEQQCGRCSRKHQKGKCPAFDLTCRKCIKKSACRSKIDEIEETPTSEETKPKLFLGSVNHSVDEKREPPWYVNLRLNSKYTNFKICKR